MKEPYRAVHRYPRNVSGRDFVVGDIHGCFTQLRAELEARGFDPQRDRLFSVGDLVDRGPESDCVLEVVERYAIKSVKGNHEDSIVRWYRGEEQALALLGNGGEWLLDRAEDVEWVERVAAYMASLPYLIEIETEHGLVGIVHADSPMSDWAALVSEIERENAGGKMRRKAIWARSRWKTYQSPPAPSRNTLRGLLDRAKHSVRSQLHATGKVGNVTAVIVGHTPVSVVTAKDNVINIDTGAVYGGKLTLMDLADLPQWIDVSDRSSVRPREAVREEPVMAARAAAEQHAVLAENVAGADSAVMAERAAPAESAVMAESVADQEAAAIADSPAHSSLKAPTRVPQNERPHLARKYQHEPQAETQPEPQPARQPVSSFVSNGMHITVRMSLNSIVNERQQGADASGTRRR